MALQDEVPPEVLSALGVAPPESQDGRSPSFAAFRADLDLNGRFAETWVAADTHRLLLFSPNGAGPAEPAGAIPLSQLREVRAETFAGGGAFIAITDQGPRRIARFTQAQSRGAIRAAQAINALIRGEPLPAETTPDEKRVCPRCKRLLPDDSDVCPACVNKRAVMLRLFRFLKPYKLQVAAGLGVLLAVSALELLPPYVAGRIVDTLVTQAAAPETAMWRVTQLVGILFVARLMTSALQYAQRRLNSFIGARTLADIRIAIFQQFNRLSLSYYDRRSTGSLMSRVTNDADNLWDFLMDGVPFFVSNSLNLVLTSLILFRLNAPLAALLLIPAPFIYALTHWIRPMASQRFRIVWHRISRMYSTLNSALTGMRVIKAFAQEKRENRHFEDRNQRVFEASYSANAVWAVYFPTLAFFMGIGSYIIWLAGGWQVLQGQMSLGMLTAFSGYILQFYAPFQNFSRALDWSTRSLTAAERVFEVLDTEPDVREASGAVHLEDIQGDIEFRNVTFAYDGGRPVLHELNFTVQPGELIGLVGHSGAGKTTVIHLLARFYDVTNGAILVDGIDIRKIRLHDYRKRLGIVLQDPFLFPGTIRDNIAYARPDATTEEILRAAKAANAHNFIMNFPDGYDTWVGERGQRLSGGERQRISIARAILHNPRILILDEATSSVDTQTEKLIQEAIDRLVRNRTTLAIAHRLSTLRNADRIVVLKEGRILEIGPHDELMARNGPYADLVRNQLQIHESAA